MAQARPTSRRTPSTAQSYQHNVGPLSGKLAIVTGASRGIGAAIARYLASKGASLVLNYTSDNSSAGCEQLAQDLQAEFDIKAIAVQADVGTEQGPELIVSTARNHFKHPKRDSFQIDIIINNAGVGLNEYLGEVTAKEFTRMYHVNVRGPIFLVQAALPYLPNDRSGRIVNISSISSSLGLPGQSVYGGTKAALDEMTRTWSRELAERATVNAVNPGPVATDMWGKVPDEFLDKLSGHVKTTPLMATRKDVDDEETIKLAERVGGRAAYPHEIAGVVGMLCSEESGWCTGSVICANGGMKFSF